MKNARVLIGVLAAGALGGLAASVRASPKVQLERCIGLDRFELGRAVERELATSTVAAQSSDLVISARCEDGVSATVRVTEAGSSRVSERTLALGEVPEDLRPRLLALVVVELIEAWLAAPPAVARVALAPDAPRPSSSSAPPPPPASSLAASSPPSSLGVVAPSPPSSLGVAAAATPARRGRLALGFDVGTRFYIGEPTSLLQLTVEVELPWLAVGVVGAISDALTPKGQVPTYSSELIVELGRFHPYLLALSARRSIECLRGDKTSLCLGVRVEGGYTAIYAADVAPGIEAHPGYTLFALGALGLEARRRMSSLEGALRVELGLSEGAVFYAFEEKVASFDGVVALFNLGIRWNR